MRNVRERTINKKGKFKKRVCLMVDIRFDFTAIALDPLLIAFIPILIAYIPMLIAFIPMPIAF